ncbi:MAG: hypothetical protein JOY77_03175 [Alphaproteobacteria bacterium]|nr:hypothetical protein [Alphaproteobacteria bacterium]MBV9061914.1 hypothetical protein [Alphaproteobacteria bacterium]
MAATPENVWARIVRYRQLAAEYDARAQRESDPEIRAELFNAVVQFIGLADRATIPPAGEDAPEDDESGMPRVFYCRALRPRPSPVTRPAAALVPSSPKRHGAAGASRILKGRGGSRTAPHRERGILPA